MVLSSRRLKVVIVAMLGVAFVVVAEPPDKGTLATQIAEGRKLVTHTSVFVRLPIRGRAGPNSIPCPPPVRP